MEEQRAVPMPDDVFGLLVNRLPHDPLQDKETCNLVSAVFRSLAEAHKQFHEASKGLADIATIVSPQQLTLILAAAVQPTLQLIVPPGMVSPLSPPPPPPETSTTPVGKQALIDYCKSQVLPDPKAACIQKCDKQTLTRVLTAAIFYYLENHLFDEATSRADIANAFSVTTAQLHKAITGIDYKSGPHHYKWKTPADDEKASTSAKHPKNDDTTPSTSGKTEQTAGTLSSNTLSSSSSSSLPDVPL